MTTIAEQARVPANAMSATTLLRMPRTVARMTNLSPTLSASVEQQPDVSHTACCPANCSYVVQGEMMMVVSSMRRNARWAATEQEDQDPLLQAFGTLRQSLAGVTDLEELDMDVFLSPFLAVVRSEATTGPITGVALSSINKFLSYGLIDVTHPQAVQGIENIADAVTHAKFVGTDLANDEVVLMKILQVLRTILLTAVGACMSNESVCELMQSCFRICFEMRLSELLRRSAEQTLTDMIHLLFSRLNTLDAPTDDIASPVRGAIKRSSMAQNGVAETPTPTSPTTAAAIQSEDGIPPSVEISSNDTGRGTTMNEEDLNAASPEKPEVAFEQPKSNGNEAFTMHASSPESQTVSYGIPCIREVFRFLLTLINPNDQHNNDTMIGMGLALLTVALETGGALLSQFPSLCELMEDSMCKNLFALLRSSNISLYAASLRVIFLTFECQRSSLKFQLETFLVTICDMSHQSYEHKEGALETLLQLCRVPSFMIDLYLNFDADPHCQDLFARVIKFLSANAFPEDHRVFTTHLNSVDALLTTVHEICLRDSAGGEAVNNEAPAGVQIDLSILPSAKSLSEVKEKKRLLVEGVVLFNTKPKKGIAFLAENGLLSNPPDSAEVASLLRSHPKLDKKEIGEYIGTRGNEAVLKAFIQTFDCRDKDLSVALRGFLESFRLPGESPVIERIMEVFANEWFESYTGEKVPKNPDVAFVLSYALIQLNVDQHNPRVKTPMTLADFTRNNRKLNDGEDFPPAFIEKIYNEIKENEIVLPSEQTGEVNIEYAWTIMLSRARAGPNASKMVTAAGLGVYDSVIFSHIWGPTVTSLCSLFDSTVDESIVLGTLDSLEKCANVCSMFNDCTVFDHIVIALCKRTQLGRDLADSTLRSGSNASTASQDTQTFTKSRKAQLAGSAVFNLIHKHGSLLRDGWKDALLLVQAMMEAKLLPQSMMEVTDFVEGRRSLVLEEEEVAPVESTSFISSIFGGGWTDNPKVPDVVETEAQLAAVTCVATFKLPDLFTGSVYLESPSLSELTKALIGLSSTVTAPDAALGSSVLGVLSMDVVSATLFLELLAEVVVANKDRAETLLSSVIEHLHGIIFGAVQSPALIEHALVCLLRIAQRLYRRENLAGVVVDSIKVLQKLSTDLDTKLLLQIIGGLSAFSKVNAESMPPDGWEVLTHFLLRARADPVAAELALDTLAFVANRALTQENLRHVEGTAFDFIDFAIQLSSTPDSRGDITANTSCLNGTNVDQSRVDDDPVPVRVLNLLLGLHLNVAKLYPLSEKGKLWDAHWERLLQSMAKFCSVNHRSIRMHALTILQSSLMLPDLEQLDPGQWCLCFERVLFPLLATLREPGVGSAPAEALEEARKRGYALLSKVFLQHYRLLLELPQFESIWLQVLDHMKKYMNAGAELSEAVLEVMKNMLLCMSKDKVFGKLDEGGTALWQITYQEIESFLPGFCSELFPRVGIRVVSSSASLNSSTAGGLSPASVSGSDVQSTPQHTKMPTLTALPVKDLAPAPSPPITLGSPIQLPARFAPGDAPRTPETQGQPSLQLHSTPMLLKPQTHDL